MAIGTHHTRKSYSSDDWITPPEIIEALGPFDLDPCACNPQPFPTAATMRTCGGLMDEWEGRVWLNPPYGSETGKWLARLASHGCGTALVFARTETSMFFRSVWPIASAVLFIQGRLNFYRPDGVRSPYNSGGPSVLIAYGAHDGDRLLGCRSIKGFGIQLGEI